MNYISLRSIIDDILLLVRNNNISESEDLSRHLIELWIDGYRRSLWKKEKDAIKEKIRSSNLSPELLMDILRDNEFFTVKETTHELEQVEKIDNSESFTKRTKDALLNVLDNSPKGILSIHDEDGEVIQYMDHVRRNYQKYRKYTFGEMTAFYKDDGHIYVQGLQDQGLLEYIQVLAIYENNSDEDAYGNEGDLDPEDEENIKIPAWMVPAIKDLIIKNELAFMLNRPSDDSNNATLASVKPHGPQDDEK